MGIDKKLDELDLRKKLIQTSRYRKLEKKIKEVLSNTITLYVIGIMVVLVSVFMINISLTIITEGLFSVLKGEIPSVSGFQIRNIFIIHWDWLLLYIIVIGLVTFNYVKFAMTIKSGFLDINQNQKGTSEFEVLEELKTQYKSIPEKGESFPGGGGIIISRYEDKFLIDDSAVNNVVIGITRSGKGELYVFPMIDIYSRAQNQASLVVNDPKGELLGASYHTLKARGYEVVSLNVDNPVVSMGYNMLHYVVESYKRGDTELSQMLVGSISHSLFYQIDAKDPYWNEASMALFNSIALALTIDTVKRGTEEQVTMYSIANFLAEYGQMEGKKLKIDKFFEKRPEGDIAKLQYSPVQFAPETTRGSVFSVMSTQLKPFINDVNAKMTAKSTVDLENIGFGDKPVAVFMVTPDYDSSNHKITSIFINQLYQVLSKRASNSAGGKCSREVIFLLDEVGNMPAITDLASKITVCLGRNIRFNLILQSYAQLTEKYGDVNAKTIIGNCGNQIYLLTADGDTAQQFSDLLGDRTIITKSRSGDAFELDKNISEEQETQALLASYQLMQIKNGESVVLRTIKRKDNDGNDIVPRPIYNHSESRLKFRYEYLGDYFDNNKSVNDVPILGDHDKLDLKRLIFYEHKSYLDKFRSISDVMLEQEIESPFRAEIDNYISEHELISKFGVESFDSLSILQLKALAKCVIKDEYVLEDFLEPLEEYLEIA